MNTQEAIRNIEREKENFPLYESVRDKVVETLSYGQKRLIALMSAIVSGESCIIIDEATDGLDVNNRKILSNAIRKVAKGRIVLVVAHDLTFASQIADCLVFMKDGCLTEIQENSGEPEIEKMYEQLYSEEGGR